LALSKSFWEKSCSHVPVARREQAAKRQIKKQRLIEPWLQPEFINQAEQSITERDGNDVPFPAQRPDKRSDDDRME
jgi:hypothetical protein